MPFALLQEETTGLAGAASDAKRAAGKRCVEQQLFIFTGLREFLREAYGYFLGLTS